MPKTPRLRLECWDYSWEGFYFVTICIKDRAPLFGNMVNNEVELLPLGLYAQKAWLEIPAHFPHVSLDEYVIMPNHIHGILALNDTVGAPLDNGSNPLRAPTGGSLGHVVGCYKTAVVKWAKANGHAAFAWQPRFFDHIIRNDRSLHKIRDYIATNPLRWELEKDAPENLGEVF